MEREKKKRIPELDGLRVLMIFVVSWYHIWQQSWLQPMIGSYSLDWLVRSGYVWVDGTVLLSAFLLMLPIARGAVGTAGGGPSLPAGSFFFRKVRRILPAYYFIFLAVFFSICLPFGLYRGNGPYLVKDLATHFTFTFNFFYDTYVATPLGAASWTLAVIVQGYCLFALIAGALTRKPAWTIAILFAVGFGFRAWCLWGLDDYTMVVNQLINFLDVYAIGFLAAMIYARLERKEQPSLPFRLLATFLFIGSLLALCQLLKLQARSPDHATLQANQMKFRPAFALCYAGLILSAPFSLKPLRFLLGNRVMRFLAGVSLNYYLSHQTIIVHLRRIHFPPSVSESPNMAGEQPWQTQYTLLAFGLSLAAAIAITYLIEKPAARLIDRLRARK